MPYDQDYVELNRLDFHVTEQRDGSFSARASYVYAGKWEEGLTRLQVLRRLADAMGVRVRIEEIF